MRKLASILALVAVFAVTSVSFADITLTAAKTSDYAGMPGEGILEQWMVYVGGVNVFSSFSTTGVAADGVTVLAKPVHHINFSNGFYTTFLDSGTLAETELNATNLAYDTHFMFNVEVGANVLPIGTITEGSNDKSNPAGIDAGWYSEDDGTKLKVGFGTMTSTGTDGFTTGDLAVGTPFMQVVIAKGSKVTLGFTTAIDGSPANRSIVIGGVVPEPGTVVMLIAGGLCLLVARFRRK